MNKKIIIIALILTIFSVAITACGNKTSVNEEDGKEIVSTIDVNENADSDNTSSSPEEKNDNERFIGVWEGTDDVDGLNDHYSYVAFDIDRGYSQAGYLDTDSYVIDFDEWNVENDVLKIGVKNEDQKSCIDYTYNFIDDNKMVLHDETDITYTYTRVSDTFISDLNEMIPSRKVYEKSPKWSNASPNDIAIQIDDMYFNSGITVDELIKIVEESSNYYTWDYNAEKIVATNNGDSFSIFKNGYEYMKVTYRNNTDEAKILADLPVIFVEPTIYALENTHIFNLNCSELLEMDYPTVKELIRNFFGEQTYKTEDGLEYTWKFGERAAIVPDFTGVVDSDDVELIIQPSLGVMSINNVENMSIYLKYHLYFDSENGHLEQIKIDD